jgi:hypothetical protein
LLADIRSSLITSVPFNRGFVPQATVLPLSGNRPGTKPGQIVFRTGAHCGSLEILGADTIREKIREVHSCRRRPRSCILLAVNVALEIVDRLLEPVSPGVPQPRHQDKAALGISRE